jgi:hypothetical protein
MLLHVSSSSKKCKKRQIEPIYLISGMTVPGGRHGGEDRPHLRLRHEHYTDNNKKFAGLYTGPYFDPSMPSNVSAQLGDTALIICKVNQVGRRTVLNLRNKIQLRKKMSNIIFSFPGVMDSKT